MSEERGEEGTVLLLEGRGKDQRRRKPWRDGAEPGTEEAHVTRGAERSEMDKEDLLRSKSNPGFGSWV